MANLKEPIKLKLYTESEVLRLFDSYRSNFELYRNIQVLPNEFFTWFEENKNL